jgi:hypothetical protein
LKHEPGRGVRIIAGIILGFSSSSKLPAVKICNNVETRDKSLLLVVSRLHEGVDHPR